MVGISIGGGGGGTGYKDGNGKIQEVDIQHPLPVDGDSVYVKDIDTDSSSRGTFTGTVESLFNDYTTEITNGTSDNPKTITISLVRPVTTSSLGMGSITGDFSNVKLLFKDLSGTNRREVDDSLNDTKYTSNVYNFDSITFIEVDIEFYTTDEVILSGMYIPKALERSIASIKGLVSRVNSTATPLGIGEKFTGVAESSVNYGIIIVSTYSDVASAEDGLSLEQSTDGTNWDHVDVFTIVEDTGKTFSLQPAAIFFRVVYTNGGTEQGVFRLQSQFKPVYVKPSSHRVLDTISGQDDAELVKANLTAQSLLTSLFENISSYRNTLNVNNAWVNRKIVNETFHQHDGTTNLNSVASEGDTAVSVDDTTGFIVGNTVKLEEVVAGVGVQEIGVLTITVVAAGTPGTLTLDRPLGFDYTTAATISNTAINMAVLGTLANPSIFEIDPPEGTIWQFTRVIFSMVHASAGDDGKFGGIAALTNGVSLRATTAAGRTVVFANWKTNGDIKLDMYDVTYSDKAPAGNNGTHGRWTFTKAEVVAELDGDASPLQKLEILIQDDLTGLITFTMRGQGRVFSP